jgi:lysozyme family protein
MKIVNIIAAAQSESGRFRKWLAWTLNQEATLDAEGNIVPENDHDGEGITFGGLTQKSDNLPVDEHGHVTASAGWMVTTYLSHYWNPLAPQLPYPVGECVANFGLTDGPSHGIRFLQQALNDLSQAVAIDGALGEQSLAASWKVQDDNALARAVCKHGVDYYHQVGVGPRAQDLQGWLNRTDNLLVTFCSPEHSVAPAQASSAGLIVTPDFQT